jgi:zinc protease
MTPRASVPGLSPVRLALSNGVVLFAQHNPTTPTVALNATFFTGSVHEPPELSGLAYLAALAIDRGTVGRPGNQLAERFDDLGVSVRAWTTPHTFTVSCVCLAGDFDEVLGLLTDVVRDPLFPEDEIEKRRIEAITSVKQDDDNPAARAAQLALEALYGVEHPYGRPIKGTQQSLARISRRDVLEYRREALTPGALSFVVAGDVEPQRAIDAAAAWLGDWSLPGAPAVQVVPAPPRPRTVRVAWMPGKAQSDIVYAFNAVRRVDPSYYAALVMNHILGQFGLGGRLADNIRERQGMAYYAYSTLEANVGGGPLVIRAGVDPLNVERALEAIDHEVRALAREGPTRQEFEDSRHALVGSIPRILETNDGIAEFLQNVEQFALGLDHDRRFRDLLAAVTIDDVGEAARQILQIDRAAVGIAGPEPHAAHVSVA